MFQKHTVKPAKKYRQVTFCIICSIMTPYTSWIELSTPYSGHNIIITIIMHAKMQLLIYWISCMESYD
jgi:hypothetical protein